MSDQSFLNALYRLAGRMKGAPLTADERKRVVDEFNQATGTAFDRGTEAVAKALNIRESVLLEKRAALDDIDRLVNDVKQEADSWQEEQSSSH